MAPHGSLDFLLSLAFKAHLSPSPPLIAQLCVFPFKLLLCSALILNIFCTLATPFA